MQSRFNVSLSFYAETCTKYLWYFRRCAFLITFFYFLSSNHRAAVSLFTTFHSTHSVLAELLSPFYYPEISVSLFLSFLIPRSEFFFFFFLLLKRSRLLSFYRGNFFLFFVFYHLPLIEICPPFGVLASLLLIAVIPFAIVLAFPFLLPPPLFQCPCADLR